MNKLAKIIWSAFSAVVCMSFRSELRAEIYVKSIVSSKATTCSGNKSTCTSACNTAAVSIGGTSNGWYEHISLIPNKTSLKICNDGYYLFSCASTAGGTVALASGYTYCYGSYGCVTCPNGGKSSIGDTEMLGTSDSTTKTIFVCSMTMPGTSTKTTYWTAYKVTLGQRFKNANGLITKCYKPGSDVTSTDTVGTYYRDTDYCYYSE